MRINSLVVLIFLSVGGLGLGPRLLNNIKGLLASKTPLSSNLTAADIPTPKRPLKVAQATPFNDTKQTSTAWFAKGDFNSVEEAAKQARTNHERLLAGNWKLEALYEGLHVPSKNNPTATDWQAHLKRFEQWEAQMPDSITAKVGHAESLTSYAWEARGIGMGDTVAEDDMALFKARLTQAHQLIAAAQDLNIKCPQLYSIALLIGRGLNWPRETIEQIYTEGVKVEPDYSLLHEQKALYLLPQWHGTEGEWESMLEGLYQARGPQIGSMLYWDVATAVLPSTGKAQVRFLREHWPHMKEGLFNLEATYGLSLKAVEKGAYYGAVSTDMKTACLFFSYLGPTNWSQSLWKSQQNFDRWRQIACVSAQTPR